MSACFVKIRNETACFYFKGCVFGGLLGLAFPLWISIGAYSLPSRSSHLDFPTYNCSSDDVNITMTTQTSLATTTLVTQAAEPYVMIFLIENYI